MNHSQKAHDLFMQGYNCAQSVFCAFTDLTGLDMDTAAKMASSFGGGMGRLRETCGAFSGMIMVAGMLYGYCEPKNYTVKSEHYALVQTLAKKYTEKTGSLVCREILGLAGSSDPNVPPRTDEYYKKRPCPELCALAAGILDEYISAHKDDKND